LRRRFPDELHDLLSGHGYAPLLVEGDDPASMHRKMARALDEALDRIRDAQRTARSAEAQTLERPRWPVIVLRSPKGWTCPKYLDGKPLEGTWRAHQVPITDLSNPEHLALLSAWMKSYHPEELFDANGQLHEELAALPPTGHRRMGANPHTNGGALLEPLTLPQFRDYAVKVPRPGATLAESTRILGEFLRDVFTLDRDKHHFRLFGPDETASNRLDAVYAATGKAWMGEVRQVDENLTPDGRVMEVLSEHMCQGWLKGYLLTGRHGLFSCYEAFIHIVDSMVNQHAKWLKTTRSIAWRKPIASLNYLLTSHVWRQDHNGFSHQDPGFIDHVANKKAEIVRIYLPPDANCLLSVADHCLRSRNSTSFSPASNLSGSGSISNGRCATARWGPVSGSGQAEVRRTPMSSWRAPATSPTLETLAAVTLLRALVPDIRMRVVNVVDLMVLQSPVEHPHGLEDHDFDGLFTVDRPVIFAYHGYPA
jgi:xylulose-5-phosphate/fructose-6-phosphate phosphoketolase